MMESTFSLTRATIAAVAAIFIGLVGTFSFRLYNARMLLIERRRKGLPIAPGHSFLFGHLLFLKSVLDTLPKGAHYQYAFESIAREYFMKEGAFYMDLWPMNGLFLTVVSPTTAIEVTQTNPNLSSERPSILRRFFKPITGGLTIFDLPEQEWKHWRATFNKGFKSDHIQSLVPGIVQETAVYAETLRMIAAKDEICYLDPVTLRFTIDMIGRTILNTSLGAQRGYNVLADSMLSQIKWHKPGINLFAHFNFVQRYVHWKNGRQMDACIGAELDKRYAEYVDDVKSVRTKAIIDLVIQANATRPGANKTAGLDPEFRAVAIRQVRLFIFAGYDSTGSVICYCFHLLSENPEALVSLRAEHDEIFGTDPLKAAELLQQRPELVNGLPYTLAVIKETMRLFAPASTSRAGKPQTNITDDAGNILPTDDTFVWISHVGMHRHPKYWVRPEEFLPERWLVEPGHELYPMKGAWRPFEHGPRNCIAQALVLVELKAILSCLIREFDVRPAYDEYDQAHPSNCLKLYRGERAFQVEQGAAHPVHQYPCRISLAKR